MFEKLPVTRRIDKGEIIKSCNKLSKFYEKKGDVPRRIAYKKAIGGL